MSKMDFAKVRAWQDQLRRLPEVQAAVAVKAAPAITAQLQSSFDGGRTVYGGARPNGRRGPLSLYKTGALRGALRFIPRGTRLKCAIGVPYARFHIRLGILPRGGSALPPAWDQALKVIANAEISGRLNRGGP